MSSSTTIQIQAMPEDSVVRHNIANDLWLSFCSGLTLSCLRTHGQDAIGELEFLSLRRHQHKHFVDGMRKLGLEREPADALRCAKYHYFSNSLGGRRMQYVEETPNKVWIRYHPPFWICDGTDAPMASIAALGPQIGRGAFRAWHAHNGAMLGNPRLAFVQTQSQCEGDPWEAGYFIEYPEPLEPELVYQRRPGEFSPPFDAEKAPRLPHEDWPEARKAGALKNFAIGHTASRLASLAAMFGTVGAAAITEHAFRTVLAARWQWLPAKLGLERAQTPRDAAIYYAQTAALIGDEVEVEVKGDEAVVYQSSNRLWRGEDPALFEIDDAIARAWSATLPLQAWGLRCSLDRSLSRGDAISQLRFYKA